MSIKPISRKKRIPSPAHLPHNITSSKKKSFKATRWLRRNQTGKKVILLVEAFFVLNSSTKTFQDMPFVQNDSPEKCFEKHSQLNLMIKPSKKFLKMLCHFGPLFQFFRKTRILLKSQGLSH